MRGDVNTSNNDDDTIIDGDGDDNDDDDNDNDGDRIVFHVTVKAISYLPEFPQTITADTIPKRGG